MATGSGKTLLMHVNILQYQHYLALHDAGKSINRVILLTPNEGLSRQHLAEFALSGIEADIFSKDGRSLFAGRAVEILDIHKLADRSGEKTIAVEAFERNNLVLVDEGHRGASASEEGEWMRRRAELCADGFSFEYSATFGQAVKASGARNLAGIYARCILFDYSYKYFYNDGYGKEYRILNFENDTNEAQRQRYLAACLLAYYQQQKLYADHSTEFRPFLLERPLWIFVGGSVNAVRSQGGRMVSDVTDILLFLASFASPEHKRDMIALIEQFLRGRAGLLDAKGNDLFAGTYTYLVRLGLSAEQVYADILRVLYNAPAGGSLACRQPERRRWRNRPAPGRPRPLRRYQRRRRAEVVQVVRELPPGIGRRGARVCRLAVPRDQRGRLHDQRPDRLQEVYRGLEQLAGQHDGPDEHRPHRRLRDHPVVRPRRAARRAGTSASSAAGASSASMPPPRWSGWRPSTSSASAPTICASSASTWPTRACKTASRPSSSCCRCSRTWARCGSRRCGSSLGWISSARDRDQPSAPCPIPSASTPWRSTGIRSCKRSRVNTASPGHSRPSCTRPVSPMRTWRSSTSTPSTSTYSASRTSVPGTTWRSRRKACATLLRDGDWYRLLIPADEMQFRSFEQVRGWQEIAVALLTKYCDRYYKSCKAAFEQDHLEYADLAPDDGNFVSEYRILVERSQDDIIAKLEEIKCLIARRVLRDVEFGKLRAIMFGQHLYQPLLYVNSELIEVRPVHLNEGERDFVLDLREYYEHHRSFFAGRELYLLRNMSRGRGIGFFEAGNFYPDFILWLVTPQGQRIAFVDPKGIRNLEGMNDPKIRFHQTIKELEAKLGDPTVALSSFIISNTPHQQVAWWGPGLSKDEFEARNVLFQVEDRATYIGRMLEKMVP